LEEHITFIFRVETEQDTSVKAGDKQSFHAGFLLGAIFKPVDGGDMFLRNIVCLSTDYTALYPRR
jgi:hypothetical protein